MVSCKKTFIIVAMALRSGEVLITDGTTIGWIFDEYLAPA
jgi:hypothetical protein